MSKKHLSTRRPDRPCLAPFSAMTLAADGRIRPCCVFKNGTSEFDDDFIPYTGIQSIKQSWFNWGTMRENIIASDYPQGCETCVKRVERVGTNRADWYEWKIGQFIKDEDLEDPDLPLNLIQMDINLSNKCNLKCRHCGAWGSTGWFNDENKLRIAGRPNNRFEKKSPDQIKYNFIDYKSFLEDFTIFENIRQLDFKGGEPMYQDGHLEFLELLIRHGYSDKIKIQYVTNGTIKNEEVLKLWPYFKGIRLMFSVEGVDNLYSYIRGGNVQTHQELEETIDWYLTKMNKLNKNKTTGGFSLTSMTYNINQLPEIFDWMDTQCKKYPDILTKADDLMPQPVTGPTYLDAMLLPTAYRQKVAQRLDASKWNPCKRLASQLTQEVFTEDEKREKLINYVDFTNYLDEWRDQKAIDCVPDWEEILRYYEQYK